MPCSTSAARRLATDADSHGRAAALPTEPATTSSPAVDGLAGAPVPPSRKEHLTCVHGCRYQERLSSRTRAGRRVAESL